MVKRPSEVMRTRQDESTVAGAGPILPRMLIDGLEMALKRGELLEDVLAGLDWKMKRLPLDELLRRLDSLGKQQLRVLEAERRQQAVQAALKRDKST